MDVVYTLLEVLSARPSSCVSVSGKLPTHVAAYYNTVKDESQFEKLFYCSLFLNLIQKIV